MHRAPFVLLVKSVKLDLFVPIALFGYNTPSRCLALAGTPVNYSYYCFVCIGLLLLSAVGSCHDCPWGTKPEKAFLLLQVKLPFAVSMMTVSVP